MKRARPALVVAGLLAVLLAAGAPPATGQVVAPPIYGSPRYETLREAPESYDSLTERHAGLLRTGAWRAFLEAVRSEHLAASSWTSVPERRARRLFVGTLDRFLESLAADETELDVAFAAGDADSLRRVAARRLADAQVDLFRISRVLGIRELFGGIEGNDSIGIRWVPDLEAEGLEVPAEEALEQGDLDRLYLLADAIAKVFHGALHPLRVAAVDRMRLAETKWRSYLNHVSTRQLPWEAVWNAWFAPTGTIDEPPRWQWVVLHPSAAIEYGNRDGRRFRLTDSGIREVLALSVVGFRTSRFRLGRYEEDWGVSALVDLPGEDGAPSFGLLLEVGGGLDVGYVVPYESSFNRGAFVLSLDLYEQLGQTQSRVAEKPLAFLAEAADVLADAR